MTPLGGIADTLTDPALLGAWFAAPSWATWRAVAKASAAIPLTPEEESLFRVVARRDPPKRRVKQVVVVAGRRGGKDQFAAGGATDAAIVDYSAILRPGERATVFCIACDRAQAQVVLRYIKGFFKVVPMLAAMVERELVDGLELSNGVEIIVGTNDYRALRGRTIVCAIMDEAAFYAGDDAASSDREVYNAVLPGLSTVPGSMLIIISSPWKRSGLLYELWAKYFGTDDPDILVVDGPSTVFNPTLDPRIIEDALARDPEAARAEWLAEWRDDLTGFIGRELIEAAVDRGIVVRPPVAEMQYHAFADPSGGRSDSFTCGVAHRDGDMAVLDLLYERRAPFNPTEVVEEIGKLLAGYRIRAIVGDHYAARWTVEAFAKVGVEYRPSERDRSAIYLDALPLFSAGRVRLIDNARLVSQFAALERRTFSTGRDRVDHAPHGADDACNSAAGALVIAAQRPLQAVIAAPILIAHPSARNPATVSAFDPCAALDDYSPRMRPEDWSPRW